MTRACYPALLFLALVLVVARIPCHAQETPTPELTPEATATPSASPTPTSSPTPGYQQNAIFNAGTDIYSIKRSSTLYYYFQGNQNGSAKSKQEARYYRSLPHWRTTAELGIRIPFITQYPLVGNNYAGLGNMELRYLDAIRSSTFDHILEFGFAFPTNANNVDSKDTEIKAFYTTKWKWKGGGLAYVNEFDQTIFTPKNTPWTSYYEGKLTTPDRPFVHLFQGVSLSLIYNFRFIFSSGGIYKDVVGGTLFGNLGNVALSITDTWGWHTNTLWKFKLEVNATSRF